MKYSNAPAAIKISRYLVISQIVLFILYAFINIADTWMASREMQTPEETVDLFSHLTAKIMWDSIPIVFLWLFFISKKYYPTMIFLLICFVSMSSRLLFPHKLFQGYPLLVLPIYHLIVIWIPFFFSLVQLALLIPPSSRNWFRSIAPVHLHEKIDTDLHILDR